MRLRASVWLASVALVVGLPVCGVALAQAQTPVPPAAAAAAPAGPPPPITAPFSITTVATGVLGGYQVLATDLNKDGRSDLISLGLSADALTWYENPTWAPHVISTIAQTPKMVIMDAADIDGDRIPEIALAYSFNANPTLSVGDVGVLHHNGDPRQPWTVKPFAKVPSTHRLAFADVDGDRKSELIGAPILGAQATGFPDPERHQTPLYLYRPDAWKQELISDESRGVVHGLFKYDWDGDGRDEVITAGYGGVVVNRLGRDGKWSRQQIVPGDPAEWPNGGVGDVAVGKLAGKQFFVTIEPFHGSMVVVYTQDGRGGYQRNVIDNVLQTGHALTLVDVDSDGRPEIVAAGNRSKTNLFFYKATDASGRTWTKALMDNDMAAASCVAADMDGDGKKTDVACVDGRPPNSVKWYKYAGR